MVLIRPTRRGLITGIAALVAAPAIVRVSSIMPVRSWKPFPHGWVKVPFAGKSYFEVQAGPPFAFAPPDGFMPLEPGQRIEVAVDVHEHVAYFRKHSGEL